MKLVNFSLNWIRSNCRFFLHSLRIRNSYLMCSVFGVDCQSRKSTQNKFYSHSHSICLFCEPGKVTWKLEVNRREKNDLDRFSKVEKWNAILMWSRIQFQISALIHFLSVALFGKLTKWASEREGERERQSKWITTSIRLNHISHLWQIRSHTWKAKWKVLFGIFLALVRTKEKETAAAVLKTPWNWIWNWLLMCFS